MFAFAVLAFVIIFITVNIFEEIDNFIEFVLLEQQRTEQLESGGVVRLPCQKPLNLIFGLT